MTKIVHLDQANVGARAILARAAELEPDAAVVCLRIGGKWCTLWATLMPEDLTLALMTLHNDVSASI